MIILLKFLKCGSLPPLLTTILLPQSALAMDAKSVATEFTCPLCLRLPTDAVIADDGFIYCRGCFEELFDGGDAPVLSPMTGAEMGPLAISSEPVAATLRDLAACGETADMASGKQCNTANNKTADAMTTAEMVRLARWRLFGERDSVERDVAEGYRLCRRTSEQGDAVGKAYEGFCLVRGLGVDQDWEDGYELLIEAASQASDVRGRGTSVHAISDAPVSHCDTRCRFLVTDTAVHVLEGCYRRGVFGFKRDPKKAAKWLAKVGASYDGVPPHLLFGPADLEEGRTATHAKPQDTQPRHQGTELVEAASAPAGCHAAARPVCAKCQRPYPNVVGSLSTLCPDCRRVGR